MIANIIYLALQLLSDVLEDLELKNLLLPPQITGFLKVLQREDGLFGITLGQSF